MKTLIFILGIIFTSQLFAQQTESTLRYKDTFVRVFDANGKKIAKGKIVNISDNTLSLKRGKGYSEIPMDKINHIKTNHSAATSVLVPALAGVIIGGIIGAQDADPDALFYPTTEAEAAAMGALLGGAAGAGIGGLSLLFRKGNVYHIQGSQEAWKYFRESMAL
ncbi:hypothetical protein NE848_14620 [Gramella jeungdoensis]|uniref:Glycine zipper family protein n=1 Tax=Gramella jeungdoensis TaxID=708091 RepID=A0ABT0Z644_9FLAO|nr:hypothetical protein [Gramella jeungdoensis]MCM8570627.1 hypothetical protein [Gramella jeungdoensis]